MDTCVEKRYFSSIEAIEIVNFMTIFNIQNLKTWTTIQRRKVINSCIIFILFIFYLLLTQLNANDLSIHRCYLVEHFCLHLCTLVWCWYLRHQDFVNYSVLHLNFWDSDNIKGLLVTEVHSFRLCLFIRDWKILRQFKYLLFRICKLWCFRLIWLFCLFSCFFS